LLSQTLIVRSSTFYANFVKSPIIPKWVILEQEKYNLITIDTWSEELGYEDPAVRPQKICSFSELTIDLGRGEQSYVVVGLQIQNADGTFSVIHIPYRPEQVEDLVKGMRETYRTGIIFKRNIKNPDYPESAATLAMHDDWEALTAEIVKTGNVPEELEKRLVSAMGGRWVQ